MKPSVLISLLLIFTSCHREEIDVPIAADFSYEVIDNDYSIPVKIAFANKSSGAQTYIWTFEGGSPETYTQKDPGYMLSRCVRWLCVAGLWHSPCHEAI